MLVEKENGTYSLNKNLGIPLDNHNDTQRLPQVRLGKDRLELGKDSIEEPTPKKPKKINMVNLKKYL